MESSFGENGPARDLMRAKALLSDGRTLSLVCGKQERLSAERGMRPLFALVGEGGFEGYAAADRIVGKAAALLYVLLGVKAVYASVMSVSAQKVLSAHGISFEYGVSAEAIINRRGDGPCPMEEAVAETDDPQIAYGKIGETILKLRNS